MNTKVDDIAVIGMSGRFPGSNRVSEFWQNLCAGQESIRRLTDEQLRSAGVPESDIGDPAYVKAAALLDDVDRFDPGFFKISPLEAELMDPQIRLLLQCAWETLEDAGHAAKGPQNIGVFTGSGGVTTSYFSNFINTHSRFEKITAGATHLANDKDFLSTYISYKLNLVGPSMTVQTACSTSLVALHQARLSLLNGECDMALAGGVTVRVPHDQGYHYREGYIFSKSGRIRSFDEGADGVVFGSGLGLVLIKRLQDAVRDGDNIHAVLKGSAIGNDGKGKMSYAASSARGQISCIRAALKNADVDASSIGFVESHGTGTAMGDPEEVKALTAAFKEQTDRKGYCALGAVKANVGHLEAAAGIVGFIKAVLAVKNGVIPPMAHYTAPNPRIKFENTPFFVNAEARKWDSGKQPRRAAVNSLGVGGTNAFVILEQYQAAKKPRIRTPKAVVVPLSARTPASLHAYARKLRDFLADRIAAKDKIDLIELAYTLQTGREAMDSRAAFVVASLDALNASLAGFIQGDAAQGGTGTLFDMAAAWISGADVDWNALYGQARPQRISLPTYAFANERYWIEAEPQPSREAVLHPLLHSNTSDLGEHRYSTRLNGSEFFLRDHVVSVPSDGTGNTIHQKVLPGVAYLEMARAALAQAVSSASVDAAVELRDIVWVQPLAIEGDRQVNIALLDRNAESGIEIDFEIYSEDARIHCQGQACYRQDALPHRVDLAELRASIESKIWDAPTLYAFFAEMGLQYGPSHRPITTIQRGQRELLASMSLPASVEAGHEAFALHPSLMDGALQAATTLLFDLGDAPGQPVVPFALDRLRILSPCTREMQVWARISSDGGSPSAQAHGSLAKLDIDLCDAHGNVCVQMRGFAPRALGKASFGTVLATEVWQPTAVCAGEAPAKRHLVLCNLPGIDTAKLGCPHTVLTAEGHPAQRYESIAVGCFEVLRSLIQAKPQERTLVQIAVSDDGDEIAAGLSGLLKTAAIENPLVVAQLVFVGPDSDTDGLIRQLDVERNAQHDTAIRYFNGVRHVASWQTWDTQGEAFVGNGGAFKDRGVYLITGGLGGLGALFAREILTRTANAHVIVTGRMSPAQVEVSQERRAALESLRAYGESVEYRQLLLDDSVQVAGVIADIVNERGQLNGILHSAGMTSDNFILKKSVEEFRRVLAPKTFGTVHLDEATRDVDLDFLVLFSSLTSAVGNLGQADYAAANGFMDRFAAHRNRLAAQGQRKGRTLAIRWPYWREGGMQLDAEGREQLRQTAGIQPMKTETGLRMFYRSLASGFDQTLVMEGDLSRMQRTLGLGPTAQIGPATSDAPTVSVPADENALIQVAQDHLCRQLAALLKLPVQNVDPRAPLEDYGIDSILALDLTRLLEQTFGPLPKTLFFEYLSIRELAGYFSRAHAVRLATLNGSADRRDAVPAPAPVSQRKEDIGPSASIRFRHRRPTQGTDVAKPGASVSEPIAIVGLSGRYPEARDIEAFWAVLRDGRDCIVEIPKDRWDWRDYYSEDRTQRGNHYSKWGGFIEGVDEFDARFFNISPVEAETLDPQERLFLQHAWMAIEDAGYTRAALRIPNDGDLPAQVGVYAGVMYGEYQLLGAEASLHGHRMGFASNPASIANRVSYFLNLHGPSMVVDTMCSSSLTAIHLACQDLKLGRTALAIAGGVNVTIHPNKYLMLSAGQFISNDGHCQSFGEGGDGYIPGEGVGAVVLKRLSDAKRDGNQIYGVIRGSALSHGGKTNGYTVPNPQAQASAIRQALAEARVDPRHISYLEAHGTGTKLGDPIEIAALTKVFQESTADTGFCLIGSAKSNIGHCEAAAGIAGLTKVLLQLRHQRIVPSLHSSRLNPHIDFDGTPFVVNQTLTTWTPPVIAGESVPRIAGLSSFGAGGSNAHLIVEEYQAPVETMPTSPRTIIVPLSARTPEQLRQKARDLLALVRDPSQSRSLTSIAYTLQIGREAMDERLAVLADSIEQLTQRLENFVDGRSEADGIHLGQVKANKQALLTLTQEVDLPNRLDQWIARGNLPELAGLWVKGFDLEWQRLHAVKPSIVSLPPYPFARQRYWVDAKVFAKTATNKASVEVLHPLLHKNTSDFSQQSYAASFSGDEFFLAGPSGKRELSDAACLEMVRAAIDMAMPASGQDTVIELRDVAWSRPAASVVKQQVVLALFDKQSSGVRFEIYSRNPADGSESVHCQGHASRRPHIASAPVDIADIRRKRPQSLVTLALPSELEEGQGDYVLHPALLAVALEAAAPWGKGKARPLSLASLRIVSPVRPALAWVRPSDTTSASGSNPPLGDIDLCDAEGNVCVQVRGLRYPHMAALAAAPLATPHTPIRIALEAAKPVALHRPSQGKPRTVSLQAPERFGPLASENPTYRKPTVALAAISALVSAETAATPEASVSLFDNGDGVYSLRIEDSTGDNVLSADLVEQLLGALRAAERSPTIKVLTIVGSERAFLNGGLESHNVAIGRHLYETIAAFPYPVIAAMRGDATGPGFLVGAISDFMVCSESARYAFTDLGDGLHPSGVEALFEDRFGRVRAGDFLYLSTSQTGHDLKNKAWPCPILPADRVDAHAAELARNLAGKSQESLRLLKRHLARHILEAAQAVTTGPHPLSGDIIESATPVGSDSCHLRLEPHAERTLIVRIIAGDSEPEAESIVADIQHVLRQIDEHSQYRCIVLASELPGFLPVADSTVGSRAAQSLKSSLLSVPRPVIAALDGNAAADIWFAAQFCDACVYRNDGRYSSETLLQEAALADEAAAAFSVRFGDEAAKRILLAGAEWSGDELKRDFGALHVAAKGQVLSKALALAESLAAVPTSVLTEWKRRTVSALEAVSAPSEAIGTDSGKVQVAAATSIALSTDAITAVAHPDGVLEVRMVDRDARNMFSDAFSRGMKEAFAHVEENGAYKAVFLTGYDNYFSSGGTRETLLAIHEGKAKFTDNPLFQLPLTCSVPVIAAMQGHGIGAGWALGMFADLVLFSEESRYFSPYMGYGFTPGAGATLVFPHKIGYDLARESLLTAREYAGADLKERGLLHAVLPRDQVVPTAKALASRIAAAPRSSLLALKRRWQGALLRPLEETLQLELAMHERTFVGQADTLSRIRSGFGADTPSVAPQTTATTRFDATGDDVSGVSAHLRSLLAHELRMQESEIGEDEPFVSLGLDSITGVTWIRKINEHYGTSIEAIKVYSYPTLTQLAQHVQEEAGAIGSIAAAPVAANDSALEGSFTPRDVAAITTHLRKLLADELRMRENEISDDEQFVDLGLDSITGVTWIRKINEHYGTSIEAIKVYSYPTLSRLSRYVGQEAGPIEAAPDAAANAAPIEIAANDRLETDIAMTEQAVSLVSWRDPSKSKSVSVAAPQTQSIAVIGMAGQFAQAEDLDAYWRNIAEGRDCVGEVPKDRWDIDAYYQEGEAAPGKTNSRWMGALDNYDRFDSVFFNISPREARSMDPQQRLFLQACWHGIEHAGYNPKALSGSQCGVFVGCSTGDYHQLSRPEQLSGQGFTGAAPSILAARISYFLDLHGPSLAIDTACSSSLVAIATACDSLMSGASDLALAGGVNVMAGPAMHIMTAQVGMLSPNGRCFTFDARANGIATGEGVGVVVLKRLADAERDGDTIYGVVEGWGVNQDGKTNGITAPNADSQARLQQDVYERFKIDPASIQLIEAHGTGTALGDPIEVAGLKASFGAYTKNQNFCALGSVKSSVGHCLSAAGISGFIKILLALQHKQLPPAVHFNTLNKHIALTGTPFYVNDRLKAWTPEGNTLRRAAINSFGFSGTNAHAVVAEYRASPASAAEVGAVLVPLSARTPEQLAQKARELLAFIDARQPAAPDLPNLAYTLQIGREAMNDRLALVVSTFAELRERLQAVIAHSEAQDGWQTGGIHRGQVSANKDTLAALNSDADFRKMIDKWVGQKALAKLADLWVKGLVLDWTRFYADGRAPVRIGLPGYPFAKERHWITTPTEAGSDTVAGSAMAVRTLHPLLHTNTSDLGRQKYSTTFSGTEFFLDSRGRIGSDQPSRLFASACLEMARVAVNNALPGGRTDTAITFRDVEWLSPVETRQLSIAVASRRDGNVDFEIFTDGSEEIVHCRGVADLSEKVPDARLDLPALRQQLTTTSTSSLGEKLRSSVVGQVIREIRSTADQWLIQLALPSDLDATSGSYALHPSLMEGALKSGLVLAADQGIDGEAYPTSLKKLRVFAPFAKQMFAWGRRNGKHGVDIDLCDEQGRVCATLSGLSATSGDVSIDLVPLASISAIAPVQPQTLADAVPVATRRASAENPAVSLESLQQRLRESLAEALFMKPSDVGVSKSFTELGLDSIIGVEWVKTINKQYGTDLSATRIYDYPSVKDLAAFLLDEIDRHAAASPVVEALLPPTLRIEVSDNTAAISDEQPAPSLDVLQQQLKASLADALFMKASDIGTNKSFTELGLDSIIGVEWVKTINKQYGTDISATRIYDYPSVRDLATFLRAEIGGTEADQEKRPLSAAPARVDIVRPTVVLATDTVAVSQDALRQQLRASLADALFMKPSDVGMDTSFTELGLDSIIGVEWVKTINRQYGTEISATRIYDYPSIKSLAAFIAGNLSSVSPAASFHDVARTEAEPPRTAMRPSVVLTPAEEGTPTPRNATTSRIAGRGLRSHAIHFEPKYAKSYKALYFHSAHCEGDFEAEGEFQVQCVISPDSNVCLKEHVVFGQHLLPTDAYIELVYAAYQTYFSPDRVVLKHVSIVSPLLGTKGRDCHVRVVFRRSGDDLQFFVRSSATPGFENDKLHMQGFIGQADNATAFVFDRAFPVEARLDGAAIPTNVGVYYAPLQSLSFGAMSASGHIRPKANDFNFLINPMVLYGGLCTVINYAAHLAGKHYGPSDDQFLPHRIGRVSLLDALGGDEYRCHAKLVKLEHDAMEFEFEIVDEGGRTVITVEAISLRRVGRKVIEQQAMPLHNANATAATSRTAGYGADAEKIAIIGMSCRYPMSEDVDAFWNNLCRGLDCVVEVPTERWGDPARWYHPDPRHPHTSYSKWAGFLASIDTFDPLFFGISPAEAEVIDPQQRIFLEECWKSIESAGYAPGALSNQLCGVYVGCSTGDYGRVLNGDGQDTVGAAFMGTSNAILAARISYYLNLKGPALAIDTACSSSLVAVHLACESIRSGENQLALAGGINLLATPIGHILTSQVGMPSRDGRCATFDASANGIVFSEGCGVVLLKALSRAEADNDTILGVIQGSGTNQDGKTNGITAPSSNAQEQLLRQIYSKFDIDPKRISYIEAHGTATPLGDPIEVNALTSVFRSRTQARNYCALGSVKSNIGHTGFAAGVAGIVKVLLCMKHRKLVPSIHYHRPNPHIDFDASPFFVNTEYRDWSSDAPRLAAVSSFGFSGTNAHVVIEEHRSAFEASGVFDSAPEEPVAVLLSAKTQDRLQKKAADLLAFLRDAERPVDLRRLSYTLQVGRDAMEHRLGCVVASVEQLASLLQAYLDGKSRIEDLYRGSSVHEDETLAVFAGDDDMRRVIDQWLTRRNFAKVLDLWVRGLDMDWSRLYAGPAPKRLSLPVYPFAQERYWTTSAALTRRTTIDRAATDLHPLLHRNTSDLSLQSYSSTFYGDEFFLADHQVKGKKVLPAVAYLEMARAAIVDAMPPGQAPLSLELRHVAWAQPLVVSEARQIRIAVFAEQSDQIHFEIYSEAEDGAEDVTHCEGVGISGQAPRPAALDIEQLKRRMTQGRVDSRSLYSSFAAMGLEYGPAFQGLIAVHRGEGELLAELRVPTEASGEATGCVLNPGLLDSALQGSILLIQQGRSSATASLPFALESLRTLSACSDEMVAWVRYTSEPAGVSAQLVKIDIDLCDRNGNVCVQMSGFSSRPLENDGAVSIASDGGDRQPQIAAGVPNNEISVGEAVELG